MECIQYFLFKELLIITSFFCPFHVKCSSYHSKLTSGQNLESKSQISIVTEKLKDHDEA